MRLSDSVGGIGSVVYITDTIGNESLQGSGVLITPDEVLTAAHVVWSTNLGLAGNIEVTPDYQPGASGSASPYGTVSGVVTHYNQVDDAGDTITNEQSQSDYALIRLSTDVTAAGTMALKSDTAGNVPGGLGAVTVTGYPASADGVQISKPETVEAYQDYNFSGGNLSLFVGTALGEGSSGGPVWVQGKSGPAAVGLVSSADASGDGFFVELTPSAVSTIDSWVTEDNAACFLQGTRVATRRGAVPVEALSQADVVLARFGGPTRIRWIGRRRVDCARHPRPRTVWPVRLRAHALGPARPSRDLWLSPDHAVFVAGALIPVRYLLNGASIVQEPREVVVYWHVELPRHDVLLAENLPAETYLDTGNRGAFESVAAPWKDVA
jgi:V8-like Glu-specific endopeptidase